MTPQLALPAQLAIELPPAALGPAVGTTVVWQRAKGCHHHEGKVRAVLAGGVLELYTETGTRCVRPENIIEVKS